MRKAEDLYNMREKWHTVKAETIIFQSSGKNETDRKRFINHVTQFDYTIEYLLDEKIFSTLDSNYPEIIKNQTAFLKNWQEIQLKLVQVVNGKVKMEELADNLFWMTGNTTDFNIVIDSLITFSTNFNKMIFRKYILYFYILGLTVFMIYLLFIFKNSEYIHAKKAEARIRHISQSLDTVRDRERKRIALDLHDSLVQFLGNTKNYCLNNKNSTSMNFAANISRKIDRAIKLTREISYNLRPVELKEDFPEAIRFYIADFSGKSGIRANFVNYGFNNLTISEETEISIFRIIQETLNNAAKHSKAKEIRIKLIYSFPFIILNMEDDGIGIKDISFLKNNLDKEHMGIRGIMDRVELLNGTVNIKSSENKGLRIFIKIPFTAREMDKE